MENEHIRPHMKTLQYIIKDLAHAIFHRLNNKFKGQDTHGKTREMQTDFVDAVFFLFTFFLIVFIFGKSIWIATIVLQCKGETMISVVFRCHRFCYLFSFKVNSNEKYFINVCQTDEIPAPEDITELELSQILESDTPSSFRIPMSISEPRITKDKSNNPVDVCDIAINPQFFVKCEKSIMFKEFFLALIAEALNDKYNVQIKINKAIILNNRKFIGTLVTHRVRNNDVKTVLNSYKTPSAADKQKLMKLERSGAGGGGVKHAPLVQEIDANEVKKLKQATELAKQNADKIKQEISLASSTVPEFKLRAKLRNEQVEEVHAEFYLPKCISSQEITLDIGEDRILLESMKHGYLFDKFVSHQLRRERARAIFDKTNKTLQVRIPVQPVQ